MKFDETKTPGFQEPWLSHKIWPKSKTHLFHCVLNVFLRHWQIQGPETERNRSRSISTHFVQIWPMTSKVDPMYWTKTCKSSKTDKNAKNNWNHWFRGQDPAESCLDLYLIHLFIRIWPHSWQSNAPIFVIFVSATISTVLVNHSFSSHRVICCFC